VADEGYLPRVSEALERFCWSTDGAVGKKSAKPFTERDILRNGNYLYRLRYTISSLAIDRTPNKAIPVFVVVYVRFVACVHAARVRGGLHAVGGGLDQRDLRWGEV
jgi:hypothetical protein